MADGQNLASIHSEEELNTSSEQCDGCWIGLNKFMNGRSWTWIDGSRLDYQNWATTDGGLTKICAYTESDGWRPDDCDVKRGFVCQEVCQG